MKSREIVFGISIVLCAMLLFTIFNKEEVSDGAVQEDTYPPRITFEATLSQRELGEEGIKFLGERDWWELDIQVCSWDVEAESADVEFIDPEMIESELQEKLDGEILANVREYQNDTIVDYSYSAILDLKGMDQEEVISVIADMPISYRMTGLDGVIYEDSAYLGKLMGIQPRVNFSSYVIIEAVDRECLEAAKDLMDDEELIAEDLLHLRFGIIDDSQIEYSGTGMKLVAADGRYFPPDQLQYCRTKFEPVVEESNYFADAVFRRNSMTNEEIEQYLANYNLSYTFEYNGKFEYEGILNLGENIQWAMEDKG